MKYYTLLLSLLITACGVSAPPSDTSPATTVVSETTTSSAPAPVPPSMAAPKPASPMVGAFPGEIFKFEVPDSAQASTTRAPALDREVVEMRKTMRSVRRMAVANVKAERLSVTKHKTTDQVLEQLSSAAIAFNVPEGVNVAEKFRVQVVIDPSKQVGEVVISQKGTIVSSKIQVSKIVTVKLIAPAFTVIALGSEEQAISDTAPTTWEWDLSPTKPGNHEIRITVDALVKVDELSANRHIKTFDQSIFINITKQQLVTGWLKEYGQWLWTTILLPVFAYARKWWNERKKKK